MAPYSEPMTRMMAGYKPDGQRDPASHHDPDRVVPPQLVRSEKVRRHLFACRDPILLRLGIGHGAQILGPFLLLLVGIGIK